MPLFRDHDSNVAHACATRDGSDMLLPAMLADTPPRADLRRLPVWFWLSMLTILLWGAWGLQSKLIVDRISPWLNQVLFPLGLLPVMLGMLFSKRMRAGSNLRVGSFWALLTGVLGGAGNIAFFLALVRGHAAVVVPLTGLFPLVTVVAARVFLRERLSRPQLLGLVVAAVAIYLLSV